MFTWYSGFSREPHQLAELFCGVQETPQTPVGREMMSMTKANFRLHDGLRLHPDRPSVVPLPAPATIAPDRRSLAVGCGLACAAVIMLNAFTCPG